MIIYLTDVIIDHVTKADKEPIIRGVSCMSKVGNDTHYSEAKPTSD